MDTVKEIEKLLNEWMSSEEDIAYQKKLKQEIDMNIRIETKKLEGFKGEVEALLIKMGIDGIELTYGGHSIIEIYHSKPRQVVDVPNIDLVPEEYVKVERTLMKKEIKEFLKTNRVNWANFKDGAVYLNYKIRKN